MHHIGLIVKDCNKSADFYCKAFGLTRGQSFSSDSLDIVFLETGHSIIELLQFKDNKGKSCTTGFYDHIAFEVDNLEQAVNKLQDMGVKFSESPRQSIIGQKILFFHGPDGERIEIMENLK